MKYEAKIKPAPQQDWSWVGGQPCRIKQRDGGSTDSIHIFLLFFCFFFRYYAADNYPQTVTCVMEEMSFRHSCHVPVTEVCQAESVRELREWQATHISSIHCVWRESSFVCESWTAPVWWAVSLLLSSDAHACKWVTLGTKSHNFNICLKFLLKIKKKIYQWALKYFSPGPLGDDGLQAERRAYCVLHNERNWY